MSLPTDTAPTEPPPTGREVLVGVLLVAVVLIGALSAILFMTRGTDMPDEQPHSFDFATAILVQNIGFLAAAFPLLVTRRSRAFALPQVSGFWGGHARITAPRFEPASAAQWVRQFVGMRGGDGSNLRIRKPFGADSARHGKAVPQWTIPQLVGKSSMVDG